MRGSNSLGTARCAVLLVVIGMAVTLGGCGGGGGASGGGSSAFTALGAGIAADLGRNPEDMINAASSTDVLVSVAVDANSLASDVIVVTLRDSNGAEAAAEANAIAGAGVVVVGPIDASGLADGSIEVIVTVRRGAAEATGSLAAVAKDATPPAAPVGIEVPLGAQNPAGIVNLHNRAAVQIDVVFDSQASSADLLSVLIADGTNSTETIQQNVVSGGVNSFVGIDLSAFADGPLTVTARLVDSADNQTTANGQATKDTVTPAVLSAAVRSGAFNAQDVINNQNVGAVTVDVVLDTTAAPTDSITVTLSDSFGASVAASAQAPSDGSSTAVLSGMDASSLADGAITMNIRVIDASANSVDTPGSAIVKQTALAPATAVGVQAGAPNEAGEINIAAQNSTTVFVSLPAGTQTGDAFHVDISDGSSTLQTPVVNAAGGAETIAFGVDMSGFADGTISMIARGTDAYGNQVQTAGSALKDTVAPTAAVDAAVAAGLANARNAINASNVEVVHVEVRFAQPFAEAELEVMLSDGVNTVSSSANPIAGETTQSVVSMDVSNLVDGPITVRARIRDAVGNQTVSVGTNAVKDTTAPAAIAASVLPGATSPANFINAQNAAVVDVFVTMPAAATATDSVRVELRSGGAAASSSSLFSPAGGGSMSLSVNASALSDGPVDVVVFVTEANGNASVFHGTPALKDTVAPTASAQQVLVPQGVDNPANFVNATTAANAAISMLFDASKIAGNETMTFSVINQAGDTMVTATSQALVSGTATYSAVMNLSGLSDGALTARIDLHDPAGNLTRQTLSAFGEKDVVAPGNIVDLGIAGSTSNPENVVTAASDDAAAVVGTAPAQSFGATIVARIVDGGGHAIDFQPYLVQTPTARQRIATADLSAFADGSLSLTARLVDMAGNEGAVKTATVLKDTLGPAAPTAATIAADVLANNPAGYINSTSAGQVQASATLPSVETDETIAFRIGAASTGAVPAANGTATYVFGDASALADGAFSLEVTVADVYGNETVTTFSGMTKDTIPPAGANSVTVPAGAQNPLGHVNNATAALFRVDVDFPGSLEPTDVFVIAVDDGATSASTGAAAVTPGTVVGTDIAGGGFVDGALSITVTITDQAGNFAVANGAATKDTVAPMYLPTAFVIDATAVSPENTINLANVGAVQVRMDWNASASALDAVVLTLANSGPTAMAQSASFSPVPLGSQQVTLDASSLPDGALTLAGTATDPAGNASSFATTVAVLKASLGAGPVAFVRAQGSTAANVIDNDTAATVEVEARWTTAVVLGDTGYVTLTDGASSFVTSSSSAIAASSTTIFTVDARTLANGPIAVAATIVSGSTTTYPGVSAVQSVDVPVGASSVTLLAGSMNATDEFNLSNLIATGAIGVTWPAGADNMLPALIEIYSLTASASYSSAAIPVNAGSTDTVFYTMSGAPNGNYEIRVHVTDGSVTTTTTSVVFTVTQPTGPDALVRLGQVGTSPIDYVNASTAATADVYVAYTQQAAPNTFEIRVQDSFGAFVLSSLGAVSVGGESIDAFAMDLSALADGPLAITVTFGSGLGPTFGPFAGTKDTVAPLVPTTLEVAAGPSNLQNEINASNEASVDVAILWDAAATVGETATVSLLGSATLSVGNVSVQPGLTTTVNFDASALLVGAVTLEVTIVDLAGNATTTSTPITRN